MDPGRRRSKKFHGRVAGPLGNFSVNLEILFLFFACLEIGQKLGNAASFSSSFIYKTPYIHEK
jgi:hypothetical protein